MASQEKISVYNLADLKNTSDDAIPNYLNSLNFRQSHRLTDVRLALGYSAFALAAACFLWDYQFGFDATKHLTAAAVAVYAVLNSALTYWMVYVERGAVYEGAAPGADGPTLRISSSTHKNVPTYHLAVDVLDARGNKVGDTIRISRSFTEWFDGAGRFVAAPFQSMLASAVPVIGQLDPKRVVGGGPSEQQKGGDGGDADAAAAYTPEMLDLLAKANVSVVGSAAETAESTGAAAPGKKGGKRRKA
ncbi:hypothetical protein VTK26DRAFT_7010 [Humicola hyalothermophila]